LWFSHAQLWPSNNEDKKEDEEEDCFLIINCRRNQWEKKWKLNNHHHHPWHDDWTVLILIHPWKVHYHQIPSLNSSILSYQPLSKFMSSPYTRRWIVHFTNDKFRWNHFLRIMMFVLCDICMKGAGIDPYSIWITSWTLWTQASGCLNKYCFTN